MPEAARTPGRPIYDDAIEHMDQQTGCLLQALDDNRFRENTLVFFTSDNGPMNRGGDTGGLRGRVGDSYEGGVRVPFMARWPGRIPAGRVVDTPAIAYDIFPTLVKLAGGEIPADRTYDGQDIWPLIAGEETIAKDRSAKKHGGEEPSGDQTSAKGSFTRRQPFVSVHRDKVTSIRDGRWKLHVSRRSEPLPEPELYDIEADPQEKHSLTKTAPDRKAIVPGLRGGKVRLESRLDGNLAARFGQHDLALQRCLRSDLPNAVPIEVEGGRASSLRGSCASHASRARRRAHSPA